MSLIVLPSVNSGQSKARIGYQNLPELGTVTASSEDAAFPVANAFDGVTSDFFKPASGGTVSIDVQLAEAMPADYLAFYNQNLDLLGGTIKLQYHDGSGYVDASPIVVPTSNAPRMVFFTAQSSDRWRVVIDCASVFSIAMISFGQYLGLQRGMYMGWSPPVVARTNRLISSESELGAFLGRSIISQGIKTTLQLNKASDAWVRSSWMPFVQHAERKPFFFCHDVNDYPSECALLWTDGDIASPRHEAYGYMSAEINVKGLIE